MLKNLLRKILYIIGTLIILFIFISSDWKEIFLNIKSISVKNILVLLFLQIVTIFFVNLQWKFIASWIKTDISFLDILRVNLKGSILDAITPGVKIGGELGRIYELKNNLNLDVSCATAIVALQKTVSLLGFAFLSLISLICFSFNIDMEYRHYLRIFSIVILVFFILLMGSVLIFINPNIFIKLSNQKSLNNRFLEKINKSLVEYGDALTKILKNKNIFFKQLLLSVVIWSIFPFKMLLVIRGFNISLEFLSVVAITYLTYMMGMIPLLPGSIGSFESSMLFLLSIEGVPVELGMSISLVFRFVTFWFEFLLSLIILVLDKINLCFRKGDKDFKIKIQGF